MDVIVDATALRPAVLVPPPSKSDAHRALALAWMLKLPRPLFSAWPADVRRIAEGLDKLGTGEVVDCGDGAAPFRILLALAATLPGRRSVFTGTPRLAERPHAPLFRALGLTQTAWPLAVEGREPPQRFEVECALSSQYASALLLAACAAHLRHGKPTGVTLVGPTASEGYLDITVRWVRAAGFVLDGLTVVGRKPCAALPPVPPDWSSLGYLLLIALASGSTVDAHGAGEHPDRAVLEHLRVHARGGMLRVPERRAAPLDADVSRCPDLAPTLAALALVSPGTSTLRGVSILRHKESDRLAALLELTGGRLEGDVLRIEGRTARGDFSFDCRNDHRLTLAAVSLACLSRSRAELRNTDGVDKSFPGFFDEAAKVGVRISES